MQTAKYEGLKDRLASEPRDEVVMTFTEIERVIGAALPDSARRHRAWWSNNGSNNVAVRYWRAAGRKTAKVDMFLERLTFVKDDPTTSPPLSASPPGSSSPNSCHLEFSALPERVFAALEWDGGGVNAVIRLLEDGVMERRRRLLDRLATGPATASSSVELIREDRDAR